MSALIEELVSALRCLPGVGPKSAQRMALYLLERNRDGGRRLAGALTRAMDEVDHCSRCRTFSETEVCALCANQKRDSSLLCIVETPADVAAIERGAGYGGLYFVLMGHLSPLDGVGPEELGLHSLARRLDSGDIAEVILATNTTVEGEATAHYLGEMTKKRGITTTRIAHGIPLGGELEFVDDGTLAHALSGRQAV